eukprot:CAMPEP_0171835698 /NCGR_PEP_ID=MMETSP0992-20121227/11141_1 /TAXON_ID=483369 /ORGANISM="non described non described, Strain CCMP2098" /LENGTH=424 /DNA_ID=CAMNT_0012451577 /DNA_START=24 /DNA_END=1298 /DNA_ORIENTATION=-
MSSKKKAADPNLKECANCETIGAHLKCAKCKAISYCSKACQKQHWKNGHKKLCLTPEERRPQTLTSRGVGENSCNPRGAEEGGGDSGDTNCPLCLDSLSVDAVCTLPCKHAFHQECVKQLRKHGVQQVCPLCRAALSPGPEKLFEDAVRVYVTVIRQVGGDEQELWQSLTDSQQRKMAVVIDMFTSAATESYAGAQFQLGHIYHGGHGVARDPQKAAQWLRKAADQGLADAQFNLGCAYDSGEGVVQDFRKAVQWLIKAADQGHTDAQYNLGNTYHHGKGVAEDHKKAAQWWQKSADQGHTGAQYILAFMYFNGVGVARDLQKAAQWWQKAADQGHDGAQYNLAVMYSNGGGVAQDLQKAAQWYRKAADQGHANAQYTLAGMYHGGQGVAQDGKKAAYWWQKAADQDHVAAQQMLMQMHMRDLP